ncbi:hypothetical protein GTO27_10740 [Candidatus Bathyarchaeota archaeon]|nr:hypothetical protein [Candidatus Bathyarchaeota archaeon]
MSKRIPKGIRKSLNEGVAQIDEAIQDSENENLIESLIQSYSKLDRHELLGKTTYLVQSLEKLCGHSGAELILNLLNRGSSEGALRLIGEVEGNKVKQLLEALVMKYGAQYQWLLDLFPNDWQRYNFSTKYLGVPPLPVTSIKIVDKSGRLLELESPLQTYVKLVAALVEHLKAIDDEMKDLGEPHAIQKRVPKSDLEKIKKIAEELLEIPKKK